MFLGEYQHTIDAKGRVSLPAKFREDLAGKLFVTKGFEGGCLYVYPAADYERLLESLLSSNQFDADARRLQRFFTAGAVDTKLDGVGRVMLPPTLREHAGLDRDVTIIGNANRVEIWSRDAWAAYDAATAEHIEDYAGGLVDRGLL
jgi:MraZ protein